MAGLGLRSASHVRVPKTKVTKDRNVRGSGDRSDRTKYQGLSPETLHLIFTSIVQSGITYSLPSFAGQLFKSDKSRINALFRNALKRGLCNTPLDVDELINTADKRLFRLIFSETHCLHHLLPLQRNVRTVSSLRTRGHNVTLPHMDFNLHKIPSLIVACSGFVKGHYLSFCKFSIFA